MNDHVPGEGRPHLHPGPRKRTSIQAPPRRTPADTARGIGALLLLTAFVAGIPALLLLVYPVRSIALPDWSQTIDSLTGPDDGHLFMGALAVVAWLAWVAFTLCVVVEAVAVVRGLPSPRLPLLGRPQRAASVLVAAAAVLLTIHPMPGAPASAHEASAPSVTNPLAPPPAAGRETQPARTPNGSPAATPAESVPMRSSARTAAVVPTRAATQNQVTVRRGDTLWGLAERHLGSGSRYREIAKLNYGHIQPDGRALTDAHWIYPGWVLRLPVNAAGVRPVTSSETSAARGPAEAAKEATYTVRPDDTLWGIAERHLGDGERYREIYQLNAGRAQEVGGAFPTPT